MEMKQFLSDVEIKQIQNFIRNDALKQAIKKVLLANVYYSGTLLPGVEADPARNFAISLALRQDISNEQIGADLKAITEGTRMVENAWGYLEKLKPEEEVAKAKLNEAR